MDKEVPEEPSAPKVEAVPEDIQQEEPEQPHPSQPLQQYPSPRVEDSDASFFQGDRQLDDPPDQQHVEPPTPPQRASRPDVNAEDLQLGGPGEDQIQQLQLAAQMSQAISGVVGTSNPEEDDFDPQEPNLQSLQQLQDTPDAHMQGQEHVLPELPENIQPSIQQDLQQSLQHVMPHPEAQQEPQLSQHGQHPSHAHHAQYMDHQQQPPHLGPPVPMGLGQAQYGVGDVPPRKRSKVSRACDECRRKKVKCDAASETELADRIHSIEGKLGGQAAADALAGELAALPRRDLADSYAAAAASAQVEESRKRPYAHISSENFSTPSPLRQSGPPSESRPAFSQQASYSANNLGLKPLLPRESTSTTPPQPPNIEPLQEEEPQPPQPDHLLPGVEDDAFNAYLGIVHHVLPFLPSSKDTLNSHLAHCSPTLRSAFIEALNSAIGSFAVRNVQGSLANANRLLADFEVEGGRKSQISGLIHLQCLILMIINTDNAGPPSLVGEHGGPAKASLLGRAAGVAYAMSVPQEATALDGVSNVESDQCIRIRAWWTLVILDRWNALSTATPLIISGDTIVLPSNLKPIVGEANFRFTLLSYIMGHWVPASVLAPTNSTPGAAARAAATFHLNMEMWRAHFPGDIHPDVEPVLHLAYWHCRLLAFLFTPSSLLTDVLWAVKESVGLLTTHSQMISPLNHHFTSLVALCLLELANLKDSEDEAKELLNQLLEANIAPSSWDGPIRNRIRDTMRPPGNDATEAAASQSLQHLADLAAAEVAPAGVSNGAPAAIAPMEPIHGDIEEVLKFRTSDTYEDLGFDPRQMLCGGYLNAIAQYSS
ncbi:hypothetical protein J7T55_004445 [Diaporthe amygdali]|uniref:uncharacterized protein n=1 Tax=Phomopsis amygdali TaxID=1214568 RepID=UPI0022FF2E43|nr:uncharacterized protein J7T55_004445 [Diaporthe amygdali]KAJ0109895.1 hypothetical protein J7T55_004445 [Diaporthe amygdali]